MGPQLDGGVTDEVERGSGRTLEYFVDRSAGFWLCLKLLFGMTVFVAVSSAIFSNLLRYRLRRSLLDFHIRSTAI